MPAQRTAADSGARSSAFPGIAGVAPWGAVFIAVAGTLLGIAIEAGSGHRELGPAFAGCFALGCITAVLLVRPSGLFTAIIQPPLLLFVSVPLAYYLFHGEEISGLKGFLITCGYPLIERFPLMLFTAAAVFVIGMARRYLPGPSSRRGSDHDEAPAARAGLFGGLGARLFHRSEGQDEPRPRHGVDRSGRSARERPARPGAEVPADRRRQPPRRTSRGTDRGEYPRRPQPDRREQVRDTREGSAARHRSDGGYPPRGREPYPPRGREPYPPRGREPYPPRRGQGDQAYPPPRRRSEPQPRRTEPPPPPPRRAEPDHHPVSRVRYRGSAAGPGDGPDRPGPRDYPDFPPRRR